VDNGLSGLSECYGSSLCWEPFFFFPCSEDYWTLSFSNTLLLCFPEAPDFHLAHYPKADQMNPILPTGHYNCLEQEEPANTPSL
jgi:hypothetical protein